MFGTLLKSDKKSISLHEDPSCVSCCQQRHVYGSNALLPWQHCQYLLHCWQDTYEYVRQQYEWNALLRFMATLSIFTALLTAHIVRKHYEWDALLRFHGNSGSSYASLLYFIRILPTSFVTVFFFSKFHSYARKSVSHIFSQAFLTLP